MSENLIKETETLCKAYSLQFKDCGNGHVQISGHGLLVNYWPLSAKRTAHCPTTGRKESRCQPFDVVKMCLQDAKPGMRPMRKKDIPKNKPAFSLKPAHTNPAGLKHFYNGDIPPWDVEGDFEFNTESDRLRHRAWEHEQGVIKLRAKADELDEAA